MNSHERYAHLALNQARLPFRHIPMVRHKEFYHRPSTMSILLVFVPTIPH